MGFRGEVNPRAERMGDIETACVVQHGRPAVWETVAQFAHELSAHKPCSSSPQRVKFIMDYFLMAREGWSISIHQFVELLKSRWPLLKVKPASSPDGFRSIDFQFEMANSTLDGSLTQEGSTIICNGALRDCAEFALWYHSMLPPEAKPLLLFDEGYNRSIELREGTTLEDILHAFKNKPLH